MKTKEVVGKEVGNKVSPVKNLDSLKMLGLHDIDDEVDIFCD